MRNLLLLTFVCFAVSPLLGQNTPAPSAPPLPFLSYSGRFLDSASTQDWMGSHRTLRADKIKFDRAHDRIYVKAGGGYFVGYKLSTFTSRIGSPLSTFWNGEQYLPFEMYVNPETDPAWKVVLADGYDRLYDFDFDSRGDIYLAYTLFGFGIVDSQGHLLKQIPNTTDPTPLVILTFVSDGHQYVITSDRNTDSTLYDATDPHAPVRIGRLGFPIYRYAKNAAGDAIALVQPGTTWKLLIYTPAALVSHGAGTEIAVSQQAGGLHYIDVTTDGSNFYASQDGTDGNGKHTVISTITPSGAGYNTTEMPMTTGTSTYGLTFESGYLAWIGQVFNARGGTMYRYNGTQFVSYDITSYLQANYAGNYTATEQIVALCSDTRAFALGAFEAIGDVFTLTPAAWSCLPGAPADVTATPGDSAVTVAFSAPASDGGSPITSYTVTSSPGSITATGPSSPITVTGLGNGTTFTFAVTATNAVGTGAPGQSNAATPGSALAAPAQFFATATSSSSVSLTWAAAAFAAKYEVLRSSMGSAFTVIGSPTGLSYVDTAVAPSTTYLYRVRSVASDDTRSSNTVTDAATTIVFTDDALLAGTSAKTLHISELRTAVNAIRAAAGLGAATFTDATLDATTQIKAAHITELRSALDQARTTIGLTALAYTDTITAGVTSLKAVHLQELRNGVK